MSFGFGIIDSASPTISTFYAIKEDQLEGDDYQVFRGGDNGLFTSCKSAKGEINLDLDFISDSDYLLLRNIVLNRKYPNKVYFREPGNVTGAYLTPSTGTNKAYKLSHNNRLPAIATLQTTEFTSGDYTNITGFTTTMSQNTYISDYVHYLFTFDLTSWLAANSVNNLLRLSLFMQQPTAYRTNTVLPTDKFGIIVYAQDFVNTSWVEMHRRSITVDAANQQCATIHPNINYVKMSNFIDTNGGVLGLNKVAFLVSTLQPRTPSGTVYLNMNYAALLVNGFMVKPSSMFNLNWRESYTGAGRTGSLKLSEV
jgi:hypothetical protein